MENPFSNEHAQQLDQTRALLIQLMLEKSRNPQEGFTLDQQVSTLSDYGQFIALVKERIPREDTALIVTATVLRELEASRTRDIN